MVPERLSACLKVIRWSQDVLAEAVDVPSKTAGAWLDGSEPIPRKVAAWLEALCFVHEAAEETMPPTAGEGFGERPQREFVPVYAYNLLRNLHKAPVLLKSLFGSDDEGAVFFLVSRGLAVREGDQLSITERGGMIGSMNA